MYWSRILFVTGFLVSKTIASKRYDVEAEALKLYGEDIHDVMARFRRTPDYLRILQTKVASINVRLSDMSIQSQFFYDKKLKDKVSDVLGIQQADLQGAATTPGEVKEKEPAANSKYFRGAGIRYRRQEETTDPESTTKAENSSQELTSEELRQRVKVLDSYHKLTSTLTVEQRNTLKDLGFEYAGHLIHSLIRNMGANDVEELSTRLPFGGESPDSKITSTTQHAVVHEVTTLKPDEALSTKQGDVTHLDSRYVFRYGNKIP